MMPSKQTYEQNAYYHPKYRGFNGIKVPVHFRVRNIAKKLSLKNKNYRKGGKNRFFKVGMNVFQSAEKMFADNVALQ